MKYLLLISIFASHLYAHGASPNCAEYKNLKKTADWSAQGLIELTLNNPTPIPGCLFEDKDLCKSKNLAKFMFKVIKWEKGHCKKNTIPFTINFCSQEIPTDRSKVFRIYGKCLGTNIERALFHYEPVQK